MAKASKKAEDDAKKAKKPTPKKVVATEAAKPRRKKQQTVRERTQTEGKGRVRRLRTNAGRIKNPIKKAGKRGKKEFHLPLPDNKFGRLLRKRVRIVPKFIRDAWKEIRLVTWPTPKETIRLTIAVFIFATVFAVIVGVLDFGLDKLFKEVIIKK